MAPQIKATPADSMFDSPNLRIIIDGLAGDQTITVVCILNSLWDDGEKFMSYGHFKADMGGRVDCSRNSSLGGSYQGVDSVGLLWSLTSVSKKKAAAFMPNDVTVPVQYHFYVVDGHVRPTVDVENHHLCKISCRRHLMHSDVKRVVVEVGRIRGTLFVPKHASAQNQCSALIDLYGTRGGISEHRAVLMASRGYASLALAYFRYKDLPPTLDSDLDLDYFEEAIDWLLQQPFVKKNGVGMVGASLGADLGMLMATVSDKVKAVVSINGYHMLNEMWPFKYKNAMLPFREGMFSEQFMEDGNVDMGAFRRSLSDLPECIYPIEKSNARFIFFCGELDRNTDAVHTGAILMERLRDHGKEDNGQLIVFPGTGHLLETPYLPHVYLGYSKAYDAYVLFGGEMKQHGKAQVVMWKKAFEFLNYHLGPPMHMPAFSIGNMQSRL